MKLRILSVGNKPPGWVRAGFEEYAKRLPGEMSLSLIEIPAPRHHGDKSKVVQLEGARMVGQLTAGEWVVALEDSGQSVTSMQLAAKIEGWRMQGRNIAFVVGGADGLSDAVLARADERLSLSPLTLPHYLVRVVLAEALYRAWSIYSEHPYHRA